MLDLKNQAKQKSTSPSETVGAEIVSETGNRNAEHSVCHNCFESKSKIQSLKDDISELHKEILKLKRQKRLMSKNYELEIAELNKKIKINETEQRFYSPGISIVINSEG